MLNENLLSKHSHYIKPTIENDEMNVSKYSTLVPPTSSLKGKTSDGRDSQ